MFAGSRLTRDGDAIGEHTGLGGAWMGAILIAGVTSLPEMATGINAARIGSPNLALGDIFGSSMANMLILAVADLANPRVPVLSRVTANQLMVGVLAIMLTATALAGAFGHMGVAIAGIGWGSMMTAVFYFLGMRLLHVNRNQEVFRTEVEARLAPAPTQTLRSALVGFILAAVVVLIAARFLATSADTISNQLGLSKGYVGMILLAMTTSLPEIVVSLTGVRAGTYDIVVGNLLGSNCFNLVILLPLDIAEGTGSVLARIDSSAVIGALFAILMMSQVMLGILHRPQRRVWYLEPHAIFLSLTYFVGMFLAYHVSR